MEYVKAVKISELPENGMKIVSIGGKDILVVHAGGNYHAINNKCTHLGGSLGKGKLIGTAVECPRHGATFDLQTGKNLEKAKLGFIQMKLKDEETYPVKIEGDDIFVGIS
jgi:3-phenylpropionate/trans-cinnamate dioxygenase ferredoxin subunit